VRAFTIDDLRQVINPFNVQPSAAMTPLHRPSSHRQLTAVGLLLIVAAAWVGCDDAGTTMDPAPAVDRMARGYLRTLASGNVDSIRLPLSATGKERVTSATLPRTLACFQAGPPTDVALVNVEIADRRTPATPAERHRHTYRLLFNDQRKYYYFFELTIEKGDSTITGFRIEPDEKSVAPADTSWPG
jgi:hypothetical protein